MIIKMPNVRQSETASLHVSNPASQADDLASADDLALADDLASAIDPALSAEDSHFAINVNHFYSDSGDKSGDGEDKDK